VNESPAILAKLQGVRQTGSGWTAQCPAHEDQRASLSVGLGDDGRTLLHCHAGCPVETIVQRIGWTLKDLMPSNNDGKGKAEIVKTYDYRNEAGQLLFQVVRFHPKGFCQRRPVKGGGWEWKTGDRIIPYRLPELLAADRATTVWIPEGEKDVDQLASRGFVATCNAMGAEKWRSEHAAFLDGRRVVILPDNDARGRKHARQVAQSLLGKAASIKLLELAGLPEKGDVSDWLDAGGSAEDLLRLAEEAAEWWPAESAEPDHDENEAPFHATQDEPSSGGKPDFKRIDYGPITAAGLIATEFETRFLVERILVDRQPMVVGGPMKAMKTTFVMALAYSLATATKLFGEFRVPEAQTVGVMSGESGKPTLKEILQRLARHNDLDPAGLSSLIICDKVPQLADLQHLDSVRALIYDFALTVLVVDPVYMTMEGGDAGNIFAQGRILRGVAELCQDCGATLILCHHSVKAGSVTHEPLELSSLAWAGFAEFARQWVLLNRREAYVPGSGQHRLWLSAGGSMGHGGRWAVNLDEGEFRPGVLRDWQVKVLTPDDARQGMQDQKQAARDQQRQERQQAQLQADMRRLVDAMRKYPEGETRHTLRVRGGLNPSRFDAALAALIDQSHAVECALAKGNHKTPYPAFKLVDSE